MVKCLCSHQEVASWWEEGQEYAYMLRECVVFGPHFLLFRRRFQTRWLEYSIPLISWVSSFVLVCGGE